MNSIFRAFTAGLIPLSIIILLSGCQKQEPAHVIEERRAEAQLDTEYRSLLAEAGLYNGGTPTPPDKLGQENYRQILVMAAGHGTVEMMGRLLNARNDINLNEKYEGRTLLHAAAATLRTANSNLLLERGLDSNARDNLGRTPLHLMVIKPQGNLLAKLFLSRGAETDPRDEQGLTPFLLAAPASARLLSEKGADISAQDKQGNSALHWAVYRKGYELAELLISLGVAPDTQNSAGKTALHHAIALPDPKMAQLLIRAGARTDIPDLGGQTPRQAAEQSGNRALMELFGRQ